MRLSVEYLYDGFRAGAEVCLKTGRIHGAIRGRWSWDLAKIVGADGEDAEALASLEAAIRRALVEHLERRGQMRLNLEGNTL